MGDEQEALESETAGSSRNDDVAHDALLALPPSLRTLADGKEHLERNRVLSNARLVETLGVLV